MILLKYAMVWYEKIKCKVNNFLDYPACFYFNIVAQMYRIRYI